MLFYKRVVLPPGELVQSDLNGCSGVTKGKLFTSKNACRILVGKFFGIQTLGRMRTRWKDDINMNLQEVSCGDGSGSGLCPVVDFGSNGVKHMVSDSWELE
jgi:hypothetical protein